MKRVFLILILAFTALALQAKDVELLKGCKARSDGKTNITAKLQKAIDDVSRSGGGKVTLSNGTFLTGPIQLKDGVELHIAEGATLLASPNLSDYKDPAMKHVELESLPRWRSAALIWADEAHNISITGRGTIDANGSHHIRRKTAPDWKEWEYERIAPRNESLPRVVFFAGCTNVKVEDVTMVGQPAGWSYWIHDCDSVAFRDCRILADVRYPNNDGIHINCSRDVSVSGCEIETGDDSIVLRANSRSLKENKPCERVTVTDCSLRSWSSAVRIGWDNDGVIRDCSLSNLKIWDSSNGIGCYVPYMKYVKASNDFGREATLVENITVSDVTMDEIYGNPVYFKIADDDPEVMFDAIRGVRFSNVTARSLGDVYVKTGSDVTFDNCLFVRCVPSDFPGNPARHGYVLSQKNPSDTLRGIFNRYPGGTADYSPAPEGYTPVYISHYGRHGSRYHGSPRFVTVPRDSLLAAKRRGTLTPLGAVMLSRLELMVAQSNGKWYDLTAIGYEEHKGIARRMVSRFAPVFQGHRKVEASSTTRSRCKESMKAATQTISSLAPDLSISILSDEQSMELLKNETFLPEAQKWYNPRLDSCLAASADWRACIKRLYTDAPDNFSSALIVKNIWFSWAGGPCMDGVGFEILDWLSPEELRAVGRWMDMNIPLKCLRTDRFGTARIESQRALLEDMVAKADEALAGGDVAATLRYGHDANLAPLMGLIGAEGFEWTFSLDNSPDPNWNSSRQIPMGSNVQIVFYKGPGPVLVKLLYNEREIGLPGLKPAYGQYYYDWKELKEAIK